MELLTQQISDTYLKKTANLLTTKTDSEIKAVLGKRRSIANAIHWISLLAMLHVIDIQGISIAEGFWLMMLCMLPTIILYQMEFYALSSYNSPIEPDTASARALYAYRTGSSWADSWLKSRNTDVYNHLDLEVAKKLFYSQIKNS